MADVSVLFKPSRFCFKNGSHSFYLSSWSQGDQQYKPAFPRSVPAHPVDLKKVKNRMAKGFLWQEKDHSTGHPKKGNNFSKYLRAANILHLTWCWLCVCQISRVEWEQKLIWIMKTIYVHISLIKTSSWT